MANKIIHKHSSVITDGKAKLPAPGDMADGELAVNYAAGVETISLKNTNGEIVTFKSTKQIENIIIENELATATALTQLDSRTNKLNEYVDNLDDRIDELNKELPGLANKQDALVSGTNIKTINGESILGSGDISIDIQLYTPILYSNLVELRNNNGLTPGMWYRITDYNTTATRSGGFELHGTGLSDYVDVANHQFDIIVLATSTNTLSEEAKAIQHAGDEYFKNSNLEAWKIWYCLDNDYGKFRWADSENGKGVIYRMIDEFGNDCPYDFKNLIYTLSTPIIKGSYLGHSQSIYTRNPKLDKITDDNVKYFAWDCYCPPYSDEAITGWTTTETLTVSDTEFYHGDLTPSVAFDVTKIITQAYTFGENCHHNIIKPNTDILPYSKSYQYINAIILGDGCHNNSFDMDCHDISLYDNCAHNNFSLDCNLITLGPACVHNTFASNCTDMSLSYNCYDNTFGTNSHNESFEHGYHDNENVVYNFRNLLLGGLMYGYGSGDSIGTFEAISDETPDTNVENGDSNEVPENEENNHTPEDIGSAE